MQRRGSTTAMALAGLVLMWLGVLLESHSLLVASAVSLAVAAIGILWVARR